MSVKLQRFFAFSFLLVGIPWILISMRDFEQGRILHIILGVAGVFYLLIASVSFIHKIHRQFLINILFLSAILNYGYLLTELSAYFYLCINREESCNANFFNKPCSEFDKVSGYRWTGDSCRIVRIIRGEVIFDNYFNPNRQGYISGKDYSYKKPGAGITRYMVFGDSFTAGEYLRTPWPDRAEEILNANDNRKYEFYSFAVDGGGLGNWHEIFFNEIIPNYEFDGIIIACFMDNLRRNFSIMDMDKTGAYFGRFTSIPKDKTDFMANYRVRMEKLYDIVDDPAINAYVQKRINSPLIFSAPDLHILSAAIKLFRQIQAHGREGLLPGARTYSDIKKEIGDKQLEKLEEMIQWCRARGKRVLLISIPCREGALRPSNSIRYKYEKEMTLISKNFDIPFYSGYKAFGGLSNDEIVRDWMHYDGHWNQQGSDRFAGYLARCIQQAID